MPIKPQIKTGKSVTIIQLLISVVVVLSGAVGLYVKNAVAMSKLDDRITVIERTQAQYQANSAIKAESRNAEMKTLDARIDANTNDINILKVQFQNLKK